MLRETKKAAPKQDTCEALLNAFMFATVDRNAVRDLQVSVDGEVHTASISGHFVNFRSGGSRAVRTIAQLIGQKLSIAKFLTEAVRISLQPASVLAGMETSASRAGQAVTAWV